MALKLLQFGSRAIRNFSQKSAPYIADKIQEEGMNELCLVVNENDEVLGHANKRECHLVKPNGDIPLHRAFSVFVFNSNNEMLLQKRSLSKVTFPGFVSNACCSHPLYEFDEERVEQDATGVKVAAGRRLNHELGIPRIHTQPDSLHYLTRIHYKSVGDGMWGEHEIDYILILHKDLPIVPNENEVSDVYYVGQKQLDSFLNNLDAPLTPWFASILKSKKLHHWWNNLHRLDSVMEHDKIHKL
ncbi:hypothetical protein LSTR_LSTR009096 [Laodelphax striatellus]|uniref:isopentenyl-diphosphate Delta-isomerase n=1 Tax=Laodelphax striatellus TaxID=195883 RepID=A0A482XPW9_LAOST|nr:hypothetical protein LSTR_LSTR009096 [Laodelphax striatellus]